MEVRPVLHAASQVLAAVEARDGDLAAAAAQLRVWDASQLRIPRVVVAIEGPLDAERVEAELAGVPGDRLALAFPEAWLDTDGIRDGLEAVRQRTGITAIVADFGSGSHPDVEFLVDYPADALALSSRIAEGIGADPSALERVRETCSVANRLGWRVIAADVSSAEEREALANAGVDEVTGAGIAEFANAGALGSYLTELGVTLPAAPVPSRRSPAAQQAEAPAPVPAAAPAAAPESGEHRTSWSQPRGASPIKREPAIASRISRPSPGAGAALPSGTRGSPGRSKPPRRDPSAPPRARAGRMWWIVLILILLAIAAYVVLAYLGHVPDPLGIEEIEL